VGKWAKYVTQYKSSWELLSKRVPCCLFWTTVGLQMSNGNWAALGYFSCIVGAMALEKSGNPAAEPRLWQLTVSG